VICFALQLDRGVLASRAINRDSVKRQLKNFSLQAPSATKNAKDISHHQTLFFFNSGKKDDFELTPFSTCINTLTVDAVYRLFILAEAHTIHARTCKYTVPITATAWCYVLRLALTQQ